MMLFATLLMSLSMLRSSFAPLVPLVTASRSLLMSLLLLTLIACASRSHVLLGQQRTPIPVEKVIVYSEPPAQFEKIALLHSSSRNSWHFTNQGKMEQAMLGLKEEAASLGANGVLLKDTGEESSGYVATDSGTYSHSDSVGLTIGMPLTHKTATGVAIWVDKGGR